MKTILAFILSLALLPSVYAQTTTADLMGLGMPGALASEVVKIASSTSPYLDGSTSVLLKIGGTSQITLTDGVLAPTTDNDIDLGSASKEFKDLRIDGTATIDALTMDGGVTFSATSTIDGHSGGNLSIKANNGAVDFYSGVTPTRYARLLTTGDFALPVSGSTIALQEATAGAACMGTATANGTTAVTVSTTCATTGSRILLTRSSAPSGTAQCWQTNIVTGTSFDLDCSDTETGTFDWLILHESA